MSFVVGDEKICVIGLGYVGLPVAVAFAKKFKSVVGFDVNVEKVAALKLGHDATGEVSRDSLKDSNLKVTSVIDEIKDATFYVVAVPTPVDSANIPDFTPLIRASETVGKVLKKGDVVVYESTVYPGATEDVCAPVLAKVSGLRMLEDFKIGYSPERINPGDKLHTLSKIVKVVSGQDDATLERIALTYEKIIDAGVHRASSIKVAEAAKVIENTQRDINIALINELALIFDRIGICTKDVLEAAGTKWNFLKFSPGLVGGHCIGVDPYYLTHKAVELGYHPEVILAGRRINDSMGAFIASKVVKLLLSSGISPATAKVTILGISFKEDVPDIRNSKVPDIGRELLEYGIRANYFDPVVSQEDVQHEYGIKMVAADQIESSDCVVFAVPHECFCVEDAALVRKCVKPGGVLIDVKSKVSKMLVDKRIKYWSL
jgi:UDP-N-acetyl-D-galactosamine dehydrogenase